MRRLSLLLIALLLTTSGVMAASKSDPLADDPRLAKKLTLSRQHACLGELLEEVGAETGSRLSVDDRLGPASGFKLTAMFRDRAAWEILAALPRLYTTQTDRWYWEPSGAAETRRYQLRHTQSLEATATAREAFIEDSLIDQQKRMQAFAALPPPERQRLAANDPFYMALNANPDRNLEQSRIIGLLSEPELRAAVRGTSVEIPLSRLSPAQIAWWRQEFAYGGKSPAEDTRALVLRRDAGDNTLYLDIGGGSLVGALGGVWLRKPLEDYATRGWLQPDDSEKPEDRPFPASGVKLQPGDLMLSGMLDSGHAKKLSRLGAVELLLDEARGGIHGATVQLTPKLENALDGLRQTGLLSKRWGSIYLLRPKEWSARDVRAIVSWPVLKELRRAAEAGNGYLRPKDWFMLAELSQAQLNALEEEFPDASYVKQFQPLFRLANAMSDTERALLDRLEGAGWEDFSGATRRRMLTLFAPEDARQVRFLLHWEADANPPRVRIYSGPGQPQPLPLEFKSWKRPDPASEEKPRPRRPAEDRAPTSGAHLEQVRPTQRWTFRPSGTASRDLALVTVS